MTIPAGSGVILCLSRVMSVLTGIFFDVSRISCNRWRGFS